MAYVLPYLQDSNCDESFDQEASTPSRISVAKHIVEAGIAFMENVGLTSQAISVLDGIRPQTKNVPSSIKDFTLCLEQELFLCLQLD
ncbi:hypothetical protein CTI12_AA086710 [Artemisia annua]|uniref:Uncharacterized protein n=1 Tax=Artemisia annua TaxID=35608 RepID=A0A2U1Q1A8_ARTAN|nr:hypothetical protein CTI12_AA086710 [Artemisia annua]